MTDRETEHLTDVGNGRRFAQQHGAYVRYVPDQGIWRVNHGKCWLEDRTHQVERFAKATALSIYEEAQAATDSQTKQRLAAHAARSEAAPRLEAMLRMARSEPGIAMLADQFDTDPMLLNVNNGTLDLRADADGTFTLRPHNPADNITRLAPVTYDPLATAPAFERFLGRIFDGDAELIAFVQRAIGYALTGMTTEHVLFLLFGPGGRNGKTTLLELIFRLLGDYAAAADFSLILARRNEGPRNDLAQLPGARFVRASEANEGARFDEARLKEMTGADTLTCRALYKDLFSYRPQFKLFLATNTKPEIRSLGEAIWSRIRLIPFSITIPESERDGALPEKLAAELPGVLNWALAGCRDWQRQRLNPPARVLMATAAYRSESDTVAAFLDDRCRLAPGERVAASWIYQAYRTWATGLGEPVMSQKAFGNRLGEKGLHRVRASGGRTVYVGLSLDQSLESEACEGSKGISVNLSHEG
ncbi:MAG: DNA primase family protein, partial [Gemmatimonadales bacterium]